MVLHSDRVRQLLKGCSARVRVRGAHRGTAFFVGPGRLLTCAHVVTDKERTLLADIGISWRQQDFFQTLEVERVQVATNPAVDLALITLCEPFPQTHPSVCLSPLASEGDALRFYGFPLTYDQGDEGTFELEGSGQRSSVTLLKLKDGRADSGSSGSAIVNERLRTVCAVLTLDTATVAGPQARATPIQDAFDEWPQLKDWQQAARQQNPDWHDLLPLHLWHDAESGHRERLFRGELGQRESDEPHPLQPHWIRFANQTPWHEQIAVQAGKLKDRLQKLNLPAHLPTDLARIDFTSNYDAIMASLRSAVDALRDGLSGELDALRAAEQTDAEDEPKSNPKSNYAQMTQEERQRVIDTIMQARRAIEPFVDVLRLPRFERCFLFFGDMGSGKTHFLASLLPKTAKQADDRWVVALLRPRDLGQISIGDRLLTWIRDFTCVQWRTLAEFDAYLLALEPPARLLVAIDDLQSNDDLPALMADLKECVTQQTQLHSLYWTIAIDHQAYRQIAPYGDFWYDYGYSVLEPGQPRRETVNPDRIQQVGAWLHLDELNAQAGTGIRIIEHALTAESKGEVSLLAALEHASPETRRRLSTPFIAWVVIDIRATLAGVALVDLNFLGFIQQFWNGVLQRLGQQPGLKQRLQACVALFTTWIIESGATAAARRDLEAMLMDKGRQKKLDLAQESNARSALDSLATGGLLRHFEVPDPELDGAAVENVELTFETFWNWRLGIRLRKELDGLKAEPPEQFLERWFSQHAGQVSMGEGILQFLLLTFDDDTANGADGPLWLTEVWQWAVSSATAPSGSGWFAAAKTRLSTRTLLVPELLGSPPRLRDDQQDLFGFIYFLASLSSSSAQEVSGATIFKTLNPHYQAVGKAFLADYFLYVVSRWLARAEKSSDVVDMMVPLTGCEDAGVAEQVAELSLDALQRFNDDWAQAIEPVLEYLRQISSAGWLPDSQRERSLYREWVIHGYCRRLLDSRGIHAHTVLTQAQWYLAKDLGIKSILAREMIKEANFAFADWYRSHWPRPLEEYLELVSKMAESENRLEREAVYYMIRHTKATGSIVAIDVNEAFRPVLARIAAEIIERHPKHRDFFIRNEVPV